MAEAQLQQFLEKVRQLNAFVALTEADPRLRQALRDCDHHDQVVALARRCGFEIGRRWGEPAPQALASEQLAADGRNPTAGGIDAAALMPAPAAAAIAAFTTEAAVSLAGAQSASAARPAGAPASSAGGAGRSSGALQRFDGPEQLRCLLDGPCPPAGEERSEQLLRTPQWRLERIHSCAHCSPEGFWYEQQEDEWVMLLQGTARLRFADQATDLLLQTGDSLTIRAGRRHRVAATDPAPGTIWLALFWQPA